MAKNSYYNLAVFLILLLTFILGFWRLDHRWSIYSDMARDVIVGREAFKLGEFPSVGAFSSAGPFVVGPLYFWYISLCYLIDFNNLLLPWIGLALISVGLVWLMAETGRRIGGVSLALILGLLTAISGARITIAEQLTQPTFISISAALVLFSFVSLIKSGRSIYAFILGFAIGFGMSFHYQTINLIPAALAIFLIPKLTVKKIAKNFLLAALGGLLPSLPLIYWDFGQNWANIRNIMDFFLIGQYRIWVSNRWLTYAFDFWPKFWASIIGQFVPLGWIIPILFVFFFLLRLGQKKLAKVIFWLGIIFLGQFILLRYFRGERFTGYLIYWHPLILLFSAWTINEIGKRLPILGMLLLGGVTISTLSFIIPHILTYENQVQRLTKIITALKERYPGQKFRLYDYKFNSAGYTYALSLFLDKEKLIDISGIPIGVCQDICPKNLPVLADALRPSKVVDLTGSESAKLKRRDWYDFQPRTIFEEVTFWWKKEKLKSSFSPKKYFWERLNTNR